MSTQFNLDASLANLPLDLLRKRYDQLTPAERKRLGFVRQASDAEVERATATPGAPTDFGGQVFANSEGVQVSDDTASGVPVTRLPTGVTLERGNYTGGEKFDVSNPERAQLLAPEMRTVAAQSQPQSGDWFSQNAPAKTADGGGDWFESNAPSVQAQETKAAPPSVGSRLYDNFLSGLGVTSDEQAKHFFTHPIDTLMQSVGGQGELAIKAKEAYQRGDYKAAVMHGLNYLVPFIGQQTDQAGEQLKEGDIAGGIGRTLGTGITLAAGTPEGRALPGKAVASIKPMASAVAGAVREVATPENIGTAIGGTAGYHFGDYAGGAGGAAAGRAIGKALGKRLARGAEAAVPETAAETSVYRDATRANTPFAGEEIAEPEITRYRDATRENIEHAGEEIPDVEAPPQKTASRYRDATRQNVEHAGEEISATSSVPKTVGSKAASTADTNHFQQARQELGADAPLSKVVDRAQELKNELKTGKVSTPIAEVEIPKPAVDAAKEYLGTKRDAMAEDFLKTPRGKKFLQIYQKTLKEHQSGKYAANLSAESFEEELTAPPKKPPQGTVTPETAEEMQDALERSLALLRQRRK